MTIEHHNDKVMLRDVRWVVKLQAQHLDKLSMLNDNLDIKEIGRREKQSAKDMQRRFSSTTVQQWMMIHGQCINFIQFLI